MTKHLDTPFIILRNDISGVAQEYSPEMAKQMLEHPVFSEHLKVVRTAKPEVLQRVIGKNVEFEFDGEEEDDTDAEDQPAEDEIVSPEAAQEEK